jgi:hypothetical protein
MMGPTCLACKARIHKHAGPCGADAEIEIRTSAGPLYKSARCECVTLGRSDADTQIEVTR